MLKRALLMSLDAALNAVQPAKHKTEMAAASAEIADNVKCIRLSAQLVERKQPYLSNLQAKSQCIAVIATNQKLDLTGKIS